MRVDDGDKPVTVRRQVVHQLLRVGEIVGVPREVLLADGVLDVQPQHVVGEVERLELVVHVAAVLLVQVVPAGLVVAQREEGRQHRPGGEACVLVEQLGGRGGGEEEEVDDAGLGHPTAEREW